ncbi:MAG: penicillin-binding protein 1B [Gammaproteobacteria bacterium]|nr:MAG: penicillin-binding protein 1B [Gammaproteobacteria bacterium]
MPQKKGANGKSAKGRPAAGKQSKSNPKKPSVPAKTKAPKKTPAKKTAAQKNNPPIKKFHFWKLLRFLLINKIAFALFVGAVIYVAYLDVIVRQQFDGKKWALPARVYARPLELYPGYQITPEQLVAELKAAGYKGGFKLDKPGTYSIDRERVRLVARQFIFSDEKVLSLPVEITFSGEEIRAIRHAVNGKTIDLIRLDPALIASIYPSHNEDRELIKIDDVPEKLKQALIAIEDRDYYSHFGISPFAIVRAMWVNIKAGKAVQGGSTLTQQLVKNFYLTSERSLWRKLNEAIMSLLLEIHYEKDQILEAYINEIYLGQDGKRAIHGFALASKYYFGKPINQLDNAQIAVLVGMVRGASYYDLKRHHKRANKLKSVVLKVMLDQGVINDREYKEANKRVVYAVKDNEQQRAYPAFIDLVRRQLKADYAEEDLRTEGLRIFTTLAPYIQNEAEKSLQRQINRYKKRKELDGAVIVTSTTSAEVLAIVGGKNTQYKGFNRALNAKRQIGSLIKPMVYYTALTQPEKYNLLTKIKDEPIELTDDKGQIWSPKNYDDIFRGDITLLGALANSVNLPAVNLGVELGVEAVVANIKKTGVGGSISSYPSTLLGAVQMTPYDVTRLYQALANGGSIMPIRAIREVLDSHNQPLSRYSLKLDQALEEKSVYLVNHALKQVTKTGTASQLSSVFAQEIAGKTGTTNDLRDSWFAGYSADKLAVVWMGADQNQAIGLTGASGAMQVWSGFMQKAHIRSLEHMPPEGIDYYWAEQNSGLLAERHCKGVAATPFDTRYLPKMTTDCKLTGIRGALEKVIDWIQ